MKKTTFSMPTKLIFECEGLSVVGEEVEKLGRHALLVTGRSAMQKLGFTQKVVELLKSKQIDTTVFNEIEPNPTRGSVNKGSEIATKNKCDVIIALGGGSAIDAAKGIAVVAKFSGDVWDYIGDDKVPGPCLPLVAIPTTTGTGSEVTQYSVLSDKKNLWKKSIASPYIFPKIALVDPLLMVSKPPKLTAFTGVDTVAHAIEAYTARKANPVSNCFAREAIKLSAENLRTAVWHGDNLEARINMALASSLAGIAIAQADTTAAHIFGEAIGGLFDIDHGITVAVFLPHVIDYNLPTNYEKFAQIAYLMGESVDGLSSREAAMKVVPALKQLNQDVNLPEDFSHLSATPEDITKFIETVMEPGLLANNPRAMGETAVRKLLSKVLQ